MSNPDSFIDEVSEEVRRDRMYGLMRRWGWVPVLVVVLAVGGAAWNEWRKSQAEFRAEVFGDAVLSALGAGDLNARRAALAGVTPTDEYQTAILSLLRATTELAEGGDPAVATDALQAVADLPDISTEYRHLALLKLMLAGGSGDAGEDGAILDELATPGAPFRTLAVEMQALRALDAGDEATALTLLRALSQDAEATESLRQRATQLIVALGASPEPA